MKNLFILTVFFAAMFLIVGCCESGDRKCQDGDVFYCTDSGTWKLDELCGGNGCEDGVCKELNLDGQCSPGDRTCFSGGKEAGYCVTVGHWERETCPYGCNSSTGRCKADSDEDDEKNEWYYKCIDGDSYYCSPESCNIVDVCHQYGCNESTGKCNTTLPDGSDDEGQTPSSGIPECSSTSSAPCKDSSSGLMWSDKAYYTMSWETAVDYCDELYRSGFSDWRVPDIDELRTLVKNCPESETGGECPISEAGGVLSQLYVTECMGCGYGGFSKLGDTDILWSSSYVDEDDDYAWYISFSSAEISVAYKYEDGCDEVYNSCVITVRCVR